MIRTLIESLLCIAIFIVAIWLGWESFKDVVEQTYMKRETATESLLWMLGSFALLHVSQRIAPVAHRGR